MTREELTRLTDEALVEATKRATEVERRATTDLLALLIELERRGLHLALGYSSMFAYCTRALLMSEQAAYKRIAVARAAKRYPAILELLVTGELTLSSIKILAPHLTDENVDALLDAARHLLKVTVGHETHEKLQRARALLRHAVPDGDIAVILDRALTLLLREAERTKWASVERPRPSRSVSAGSRYVPASVQRVVWTRDSGQCAFVGPAGRCGETGCLEFHHVVPFNAGGKTDQDNLELRCRAHNQHEAKIDAVSARRSTRRAASW